MRRSTFLVIFITAGITLGLFQLKYTVMRLEQDYKKINNSIRTLNESIHVLKAEWSFLNRPERLQQLAQKHLDFHPIEAKQLISFKTLSENYLTPLGNEENRQELDRLVAQVNGFSSEQGSETLKKGE